MKQIEVERYEPSLAGEWDAFIAGSKNGTFLFKRGFMDYHSARFADASLVLRRGGRLLAVLPGNISGEVFHSHQGLTYGGLVAGEALTAAFAVEIFGLMNEFLRTELGAKKVVYKPVPWIYHKLPAEEALYAIVKVCGARLAAREISTCIALEHKIKMAELRRRCIKKAERSGIEVSESADLGAFWKILGENLEGRYGVRPVHSLEEIELLKSRFPQEIRLHVARSVDGAILAGILTFETATVIHTQYIAASPAGKSLGALDLIVAKLMENPARKRFLDFGKSTEDAGRFLNETLIAQKEGFGGRGLCYDTYEWDL